MEESRNMDEVFEQDYYSRTAKSIDISGLESIKIMKWIAYCDPKYEMINYFNLLASFLSVQIDEVS